MPKSRPTFCIDVWPPDGFPAPTPSPKADRVWVSTCAPQGGAIVVTSRTPRPMPAVPEEMYLREVRDLDLADEVVLAGFTAEYGWIGVDRYSTPPAADGGLPVPYVHALLDADVRPSLDEDAQEGFLRDVAARRDAVTSPALGTVDEVRLAVNWLRDLTDLATAYVHIDPDAFEGGPEVWRSGEWIARPADSLQSRLILAGGLSGGLRGFHARAFVNLEIAGRDHARNSVGRAMPGLYAAVLLQVFNHVAEFAPIYRRCPVCNTTFVRQRGRAVKRGPRREGVSFCSRRCANTSAQRTYRANRKDAT